MIRAASASAAIDLKPQTVGAVVVVQVKSFMIIQVGYREFEVLVRVVRDASALDLARCEAASEGSLMAVEPVAGSFRVETCRSFVVPFGAALETLCPCCTGPECQSPNTAKAAVKVFISEVFKVVNSVVFG